MANSKKLQVVILAAGQGTRMKSPLPKPLVPVLGQPMLSYILDSLSGIQSAQNIEKNIGVVVGHQKEKVEEFLETREESFQLAWQKEQKGTAHALECFFEENPSAWESDYIAVVCGDTPLLDSEDLTELFSSLYEEDLDGVCASFEAKDPTGFGRILQGEKGFAIKEEKDASDEQRKITEVNSGLYFFKTSYVKTFLGDIDSENKSGEFYLTDLFAADRDVKTIKFDQAHNFLGINDLNQLSVAEEILQKRKFFQLRKTGVRLIRSDATYIEWGVTIEEGTHIYPGVCLEGETSIGKRCVIESGVVIKDSIVESEVKVLSHSHLDQVVIDSFCSIGPFARLRPQTKIEENVKIGNFVETKKSLLKKGSKVSHLSYVGDADIGEEANIGCGFITCNYDGANKHKTVIGAGTFVGSDCQMIAPINIGEKSFIAAGSTITNDVPDGGFAIARGKQVTKEGAAKRFLKTKKQS